MSILELSLSPGFRLESGARVVPGRLTVSSAGDAAHPAVVVLGGISAGARVAGSEGWWRDLIGPGKPIDTSRYRIIGLDFIGGRGGTGGPDPADSAVTTGDQAAALALALDRLGIQEAACVIGASYGGMVALAFARAFPRRIGRAVIISASHEPHPMATALRSIQRRIVGLGVEAGRPRAALEIARGLAMTTYRTSEEFGARFGTAPSSAGHWPVEDYLESSGRGWAESWSPEAFLTLSLSLDLHRVNPAEVHVPVTLVAVKGDRLVPLEQMERLYRELPVRAGFHVLDSRYGHDAFLKEFSSLGPILRTALLKEAA